MQKFISKLKNHAKAVSISDTASTFLQLEMVRQVISLTLGSFFIILIFRVTNDFALTILGLLFYFGGVFLGYLVANIILARVGYIISIKISFLLEAAILAIAVMNYDRISEIIYLFTLCYGIAGGIFFATRNLFQLEILTSESRQSIYLMIEGLTHILGTVLPVFTGFLIADQGYRQTFIVTILINLAGLLIPSVKLDKPDSFKFRELVLMTRLKGFSSYSLATLFASYIGELRNLAFILAPFLILGKSELNVGILAAAVSLTAGVIAVVGRNTKNAGKYADWSAIFIFMPANILFGIFWNPITVTLRALVSPIGSIFYNSRQRVFEVSNMQTLLGHHLTEDGLELQLYREGLLFAGRALACFTFIILLDLAVDFEVLARIIIIVFAAWPAVHLKLVEWLEKKLIQLKKT
jgi:MFS family permease